MIKFMMISCLALTLVAAGCGKKADDTAKSVEKVVTTHTKTPDQKLADYDFLRAVPSALETVSPTGQRSYKIVLPPPHKAKMSDYNPSITRSLGLGRADDVQSARGKMDEFFAKMEQAPGLGYSISMGTGTGGELLLMGSNDRMLDDSVRAYDVIARFHSKDRSFIDAGGRVKCWRVESSNQWTDSLCP